MKLTPQVAAAVIVASLIASSPARAGLGLDVALGTRRAALSGAGGGAAVAQGRETALTALWAPFPSWPVALTGGYGVVSFAGRGGDMPWRDFSGTEATLGAAAWLRVAPVLTAGLALDKVARSRYQLTGATGREDAFTGQGEAVAMDLAWEVVPLAQVFLRGRWLRQTWTGDPGLSADTALAAGSAARVSAKSQSILVGFGLRL